MSLFESWKRVFCQKPKSMERDDKFLEAAHKHSMGNEKEILESNLCGCFYCLSIFSPDEVIEWIDEPPQIIGRTAECPRCQIDSVIGSKSGYPINPIFLRQMQKRWFS